MSSGESLFTSDDVFWLRLMVRVPGGGARTSAEGALVAALRTHPSPLVGGDGFQPDLRLLPGEQGAQPIRA
jgi:hypothetical protein